MGEIADALRRARRSREEQDPQRRGLEQPDPQARHDLEQPDPRAHAGAEQADLHPPQRERSAITESLRQAERDRLAAREAATTPAREDPVPEAAQPPPPPARQGLPEAARPAGQRVATLAPTDPGIVVDEGAAVQACRQLAVQVREEIKRRGARHVALVSAVRDEGKTTVLCNLAIALSTLSEGRRVALLDLDLRRPSIARVLGLSPQLGIEDVLRGQARLEEAAVACEHPELDIYPTARPQRNAHDLLVASRFEEILAELADRYSLVLIDTAPTLIVPDVSLMLSSVDACIPVARCGVSRVRSFRQLVEVLPDDKLLGSILNGGRVGSYTAYVYDYQSAAGAAANEAALHEDEPEEGRREAAGRGEKA